MIERESFIDLPGGIAWPIDRKEEVLLWGWDRQLWPQLAKSDSLALTIVLRKRLRARAFAERAQAHQLAGTNGVAIIRHLVASDLFEAAARGWRLVADRLSMDRSVGTDTKRPSSRLEPSKS